MDLLKIGSNIYKLDMLPKGNLEELLAEDVTARIKSNYETEINNLKKALVEKDAEYVNALRKLSHNSTGYYIENNGVYEIQYNKLYKLIDYFPYTIERIRGRLEYNMDSGTANIIKNILTKYDGEEAINGKFEIEIIPYTLNSIIGVWEKHNSEDFYVQSYATFHSFSDGRLCLGSFRQQHFKDNMYDYFTTLNLDSLSATEIKLYNTPTLSSKEIGTITLNEILKDIKVNKIINLNGWRLP